jgi:hypothetical protein
MECRAIHHHGCHGVALLTLGVGGGANADCGSVVEWRTRSEGADLTLDQSPGFRLAR